MYRSIPSNWSLDKIFALTGELGQVQFVKITISDFPPCGKTVVFVSEFVIFLKPSKLVKWLLHGGISKVFL